MFCLCSWSSWPRPKLKLTASNWSEIAWFWSELLSCLRLQDSDWTGDVFSMSVCLCATMCVVWYVCLSVCVRLCVCLLYLPECLSVCVSDWLPTVNRCTLMTLQLTCHSLVMEPTSLRRRVAVASSSRCWLTATLAHWPLLAMALLLVSALFLHS